MSVNESTSSYNSSKSSASTPTSGTDMKRDTLNQMLDIMEDLLAHTHVFYDDYATACGTVQNCTAPSTTCTRGTV